ncbi:hypothetical protein CRUP_024176, partial [Coryphaenoides rupestris]
MDEEKLMFRVPEYLNTFVPEYLNTRVLEHQRVPVGSGVLTSPPAALMDEEKLMFRVPEYLNTFVPEYLNTRVRPAVLCSGQSASLGVMEPGSAELSFLPEDSDPVQSFVARLRLRAQRELDPLHALDLSDGFLIKFLRARDFDLELSLK